MNSDDFLDVLFAIEGYRVAICHMTAKFVCQNAEGR